eukprot:TRINITY_DN31072_c0_g1_i1.p1 TRINITY_DN31072_c0_g1~~TRINITY_DN31072_c0_g1_i1.p1  ORF type:complete len:183 (+),score=49.27 TRINITY_DN31072_c0_g1_i1:57-551(+)
MAFRPILMHGKVGRGFQRGSRQLGFPTANLDLATEGSRRALHDLRQGVYYGWAKVQGDEPRPAAISVGDNPTFEDMRGKVVVEAHILHKFKSDFYGEPITCILAGYIRPMEKYDTLDKLIEAIKGDVEYTERHTRTGTDGGGLREHGFFLSPTAEGAGQLKALL